MPTDPLTGSRYPVGSDAPNIAQYIQNAVTDLSDNTIPRFATTTARDSAYTAWVAAGNTMVDGLHCAVAGVLQEYTSGTWGAPKVEPYGFELLRTTAVGGNVAVGAGTTVGFSSSTIVKNVGGYYTGSAAVAATVPANRGGLYLVGVHCRLDLTVSSRFFAEVLINGGTTNGLRVSGNGDSIASGSRPIRLAAGTTLGVSAYQDTGATRNAVEVSLTAHLISV